MKTEMKLIRDIDQCVLDEGSKAFWWLGQLGFVVKLGEKVLYLHPFLSEDTFRNIPPLLRTQEVINADFIFGSHDHSDHIDRKVWSQLASNSPNAKFIVPRFLVDSLCMDLKIPHDCFIGLDDGISIKEQGLETSGIAAAHEFLDQDPVTGCYPYLGYIIEGNGCSVYHAGDTCVYEGMYSKIKKWSKIDVMFVPINGRDGRRYRSHCIGNMTYQEAVDLVGYIRPGLVVPGHYEMFNSNSENPLLFADYLEAKYQGIEY